MRDNLLIEVDELDQNTAQEVLRDYENGTIELDADSWQRIINSVYSMDAWS